MNNYISFFKKIFKLKFVKRIMVLVSFVLPVLSCFGIGVSTSNHSSIKKESLSASISSVSKTNVNGEAFLKFCSTDKNDEYKNMSRTVYLSNWRDNFGYTTQFLCLSSEKSYEPLSVKISNNSIVLCESTTLVDACNYSSQKEILRFETLRMNIYKFRERQFETNCTGLDGFIYIPDYLADYIIENSNGRLQYYDDLLIDGPIPTELEDYLVLNVMTDRKELRFKIANVFHVAGYNLSHVLNEDGVDKCLINDSNTGEKMKCFLGDFCVAYSYGLIQENNFCIASSVKSKQYAIIDYLNIISMQSSYHIDGLFYCVNVNGINVIQSSGALFDSFNTLGFSSSLSVVFLVISIVLFIATLLIDYYCYKNVFAFSDNFVYHIIQVLLLVFLHSVMTILSVFLSNSFVFQSVYSKYLGITSLLLLVFFLFFIFKDRKAFKND